MRLSLFSLGLLTIVLSAPVVSAQEPIVLPEGAPIRVVIAQDITSKEAKPNDSVAFTIDEDVTINGQVVVRKGTAATGSVVNAEKSGYLGKSGKLAIQVESAQSVDGGKVKLRAAKGGEGKDKGTSTAVLSVISPVFLFKKGGEAKITAGTPLTVYVAEEKQFRLEGATLIAIGSGDAGPVNTSDATVFIYRPDKLVGKALEPSVFVDDVELARMDNGRYFALKVKPGKHLVHMTDDQKGYSIDMGPGQTYFFRIGIEMGMMKGHGKITLDEAERATAEIKKLKFIGKDKVKAPDMVIELTPQ